VSCNIRETTAGEVDKGGIVFPRFRTDMLGQVRSDGMLLVPWPREVKAKTARRTNPGDLWIEAYSSTDTSDVGACCLKGTGTSQSVRNEGL
jgi:hypothetical protein